MSCASPIPRSSPSLLPASSPCVLRSPSFFPIHDDLPTPLMAPRSPFGLHAFSFAHLPSHPPTVRSPCSACSCTDSLSCPSCLRALASPPSRSGGSGNPVWTPTNRSSALLRSSPAAACSPPPTPLSPPATPTIKKVSPIDLSKLSDQIALAAERSRSILASLQDNQASTPERVLARRFPKECGEQTIGSRGKEDYSPLDKSLEYRKDGDTMASAVLSPLKRKRPPKLCIPEEASLVGLGRSLLLERVGQEHLDNYSVENSLFGISCKKGRRDVMEDTHRVITNFQGNPNQAFFGVFDGHGGRKAAEFVAENLPERIADAIEKVETGQEDLEQAVHTGYLNTDAVFLAKRVTSGACSVSALVKDGQLVVANAGDCRAVLSRSGKAESLTRDHRACREDERKRIENLGGYVDCFNGVWRVQGTLSVTRGFGDMHLKQWISAEPDVKKLELTQDCEFLILASDGLWEKVSDQEAVDCARASLGLDMAGDSNPCKAQKLHSCRIAQKKDDEEQNTSLVSACQKLIKMASNRGSIDDITVLIVSVQKSFCKSF